MGAPFDSIRPELVERYRQLRDFDSAEAAFVEALVLRPNRLARPLEIALRQALNLARLWVVPNAREECIVGPQLGDLRARLRPLAQRLRPDIDPNILGAEAKELQQQLPEIRQHLLSTHVGKLSAAALDKEICEKSLVLVLGGGGGCGYVHLGTLATLDSLGILPKLIVASSMGSVIGAFRAKQNTYDEQMVHAVSSNVSFRRLFSFLDQETRYSMPGTFRLQLRATLLNYFLREDGQPLRINELAVPFICMVTGVRRGAVQDLSHFERLALGKLRLGAWGRLMHLKDLLQNTASLLAELIKRPEALEAIPLGLEPGTEAFDVIDAVGFSSAVPSLIQYDVTRDDPRMHLLIQEVLQRRQVAHLVDGGVISNVPARAAWEAVQMGRLHTRNTFIMAFDCFQPQLGRNIMFSPIQRLAAENVAVDRHFAHFVFAYKKVLSPLALIPDALSIQAALRNGRSEFTEKVPFVQKMLEQLPPIPPVSVNP